MRRKYACLNVTEKKVMERVRLKVQDKRKWKVYQSANAVITNYLRLRDLNNKYLFFTLLEAEKSRIKVLVDLGR